jgi:hypothetical protein
MLAGTFVEEEYSRADTKTTKSNLGLQHSYHDSPGRCWTFWSTKGVWFEVGSRLARKGERFLPRYTAYSIHRSSLKTSPSQVSETAKIQKRKIQHLVSRWLITPGTRMIAPQCRCQAQGSSTVPEFDSTLGNRLLWCDVFKNLLLHTTSFVSIGYSRDIHF